MHQRTEEAGARVDILPLAEMPQLDDFAAQLDEIFFRQAPQSRLQAGPSAKRFGSGGSGVIFITIPTGSTWR